MPRGATAATTGCDLSCSIWLQACNVHLGEFGGHAEMTEQRHAEAASSARTRHRVGAGGGGGVAVRTVCARRAV